MHAGEKLIQQPGFAGPGLAYDPDHVPMAACHLAQHIVQNRVLPFAADKPAQDTGLELAHGYTLGLNTEHLKGQGRSAGEGDGPARLEAHLTPHLSGGRVGDEDRVRLGVLRQLGGQVSCAADYGVGRWPIVSKRPNDRQPRMYTYLHGEALLTQRPQMRLPRARTTLQPERR